MRAVVFLGPTLRLDEARRILDADYRAPAARGSVLAAVRDEYPVVVIVDGLFDSVPAVWHKEILWAMSEGVHVFGGASMGALRAAELADFGMVGVGSIFDAYRGGQLEADDEVAVAHGDLESDYRPFSDALVDIRATLDRAVTEAVITETTRSRLLAVARRTHYAERSHVSLLEAGRGDFDSPAEAASFTRWLPEGRVARKRADAILLLETVRDFLRTEPPPKRVRYSFEHTDAWDTLLTEVDSGPS